MTEKPTKITVSDLEKLELLLDDAPIHQPTAVTKREAIVRLAPRLHHLHAKGYSWLAVAAWLSEHGLTVSPSVLGEHLRDVPVPNPRSRGGHTKRRHHDVNQTSAAPSPPPNGVQHSLTEPELQRSNASDSATSGKQAPIRLVPASAHAGDRRSGFDVRPDSDDI